jgi:hypothetical protein
MTTRTTTNWFKECPWCKYEYISYCPCVYCDDYMWECTNCGWGTFGDDEACIVCLEKMVPKPLFQKRCMLGLDKYLEKMNDKNNGFYIA